MFFVGTELEVSDAEFPPVPKLVRRLCGQSPAQNHQKLLNFDNNKNH